MQQTYTPPGIFGKKWPGLDENGSQRRTLASEKTDVAFCR
jgi:hypothetical protein